MCIHCTPGVDCAHDRETDTWVVPRGLTSTDSARPATQTHERDEDAPALTPDGFTGALLRRDGGR